MQLSWLWSEGSRKASESNSDLESIQNELLNPFIQSRRNSITKSDIMQHNKSSVSSKSVKACWHREWVKLMGPYGEKEGVNKPPCLPTREVCGSILDCKYISCSLNPSIEMPCRHYEWWWAYQGVLWREVMSIALTHLGIAQACEHWPGCTSAVPQAAQSTNCLKQNESLHRNSLSHKVLSNLFRDEIHCEIKDFKLPPALKHPCWKGYLVTED